jgi:hypothetical protein
MNYAELRKKALVKYMNPILGTSFLSLFAKLKFSNYSLPFKADPEEGNEQRFNGLQQTKG